MIMIISRLHLCCTPSTPLSLGMCIPTSCTPSSILSSARIKERIRCRSHLSQRSTTHHMQNQFNMFWWIGELMLRVQTFEENTQMSHGRCGSAPCSLRTVKRIKLTSDIWPLQLIQGNNPKYYKTVIWFVFCRVRCSAWQRISPWLA